MDGATPYAWFKKFCKRNNMRFVNLHSFRHLNASLLINSGVNVRTVSACLGHSQTSTTLNIYAHTFEQANAKAMEAVANALDFSGNSKDQKHA
jgi:integrase